LYHIWTIDVCEGINNSLPAKQKQINKHVNEFRKETWNNKTQMYHFKLILKFMLPCLNKYIINNTPSYVPSATQTINWSLLGCLLSWMSQTCHIIQVLEEVFSSTRVKAKINFIKSLSPCAQMILTGKKTIE